MNYRKHLKTGLKLIVESDGSIVTLAVRLSKRQLLDIIDYVLPDEEQIQGLDTRAEK